jgi:Domain of unknown function (DUF4386)
MSNSEWDRFSPLLLARICGTVALAGIVAGAFDIGYIRSTLIVAGNAPATIHNILAHETLFRLGFGAHLFEMLLNIVGEILFFFLMRRVNRIVAAIVLACGLVGTAIEGLDLLNAYAPLVLALNANTLGAFTPQQLQSLSYIFVQLQDAGLVISFAFYGLDELLSGFLIFRSGFLPRAIGILLSIAGLCYFTHSFLSFVAPSVSARVYPYILYACLPGEASIALWMAIVGLNVDKWRAWTQVPQAELAGV